MCLLARVPARKGEMLLQRLIMQSPSRPHSPARPQPPDEVVRAAARGRMAKGRERCVWNMLEVPESRAVIRGSCVILFAVWQCVPIPPDCRKRGLDLPIWRGKRDRRDCDNYPDITRLAFPGKEGDGPFALADIGRDRLFKLTKKQQCRRWRNIHSM